MKIRASLVAVALATGTTAWAQTQGVSKTEIVIGTIQDLSGPIAAFGKQVRQGMVLRVDELNEQGGINGRKLVLKVEDSAYDPKRAVLSAQKLVNQDKIFMMVGHIGTAQNIATFPVLFTKNIVNFFPVSAGREMFEAPNEGLKYAFAPTYYEGLKIAVPRLVKEKNAQKVCSLYQDDDYGLEVQKGAEDGLKAIGMSMLEKTTYKRGATDFSSQMQKLAASQCDLVVLGTIIRETIGAITTARRMNFNPTFLAAGAAYTELIHKLGGPAVNGLYATMFAQQPYMDEPSQPIRFWATKYHTKFGDEPSVYSIYGYNAVDVFAKAATQAGAGLSTESFVKAMNTMKVPADIFGTAEMTFSATKRLGTTAARLSQIQDGRWKVVSPYFN